MPFSENISLPGNQCEICGAELSDEIVIQEFADGSIARLCAECAAGAALQSEGRSADEEFRFPDVEKSDEADDGSLSSDDSASFVEADAAAVAAAQTEPADELDPFEKTRELLTPVVDLITLQTEMQGALQRLATSLETFATGVFTEKTEKTATVEGRLETLERELELTRVRLRETEALLAAGGVAAAASQASAPAGAPVAPPVAIPLSAAAAAAAAAPATEDRAAAGEFDRGAAAVAAGGALAAVNFFDIESTIEATAETTMATTVDFAQPEDSSELVAASPAALAVAAAAGAAAVGAEAPGDTAEDTGAYAYSAADLAAQATPPPVAPPILPPPVAPPAGTPTAEHHAARPGFQLAEVQLAQKNFNESQFTNRIRDVRRSLGKPRANLTKLVGPEPRALLTITWDIIWYQYLIDLRRDIPSEERVTLHREGMDLDELASIFREKNSSVDDEGRLDASELEVKLLSDPSTLITAMSDDEERALEDATEEIWDQKTAPEFKWDD